MVLAESLYEIKQRYEDTALVLFRERQNKPRPLSYLSTGESRKCYTYSCHGNSAVVVYKKGNVITKSDEKSVESEFCVIL